jgi:excisionase family DNA binding protein
MTGRELIVYISTNHLEDEPVFKNGRFIGAMTIQEAAAKMDVGSATIFTWIAQGVLPYLVIEGKVYIPANATSPIESSKV